jgi:hypothetical protein
MTMFSSNDFRGRRANREADVSALHYGAIYRGATLFVRELLADSARAREQQSGVQPHGKSGSHAPKALV